jgi:hypothetical protein
MFMLLMALSNPEACFCGIGGRGGGGGEVVGAEAKRCLTSA